MENRIKKQEILENGRSIFRISCEGQLLKRRLFGFMSQRTFKLFWIILRLMQQKLHLRCLLIVLLTQPYDLVHYRLVEFR